jgi:predicted CXXCH cytochrome family protein
LVEFETKYELCRGCHQHEGSSAPELLAASR